MEWIISWTTAVDSYMIEWLKVWIMKCLQPGEDWQAIGNPSENRDKHSVQFGMFIVTVTIWLGQNHQSYPTNIAYA